LTVVETVLNHEAKQCSIKVQYSGLQFICDSKTLDLGIADVPGEAWLAAAQL